MPMPDLVEKQTLRWLLRLACLIAVPWCGAVSAHAQSRTYSCPKGNAITLTVVAPNAIKAGPIEGGTMRLKQSPGDPLRFSDSDYAVQISSDQTGITVEIPDWGSAKCSFRPQACRAGRPARSRQYRPVRPGLPPGAADRPLRSQ